MIKKLPFLLLVLFLLQIKFIYSQSNKTFALIDNFEIIMKEANLSKSQILQIKDLLVKNDQLIAEDAKLQKELNAKYPFVFHDEETTTKYRNQKFVKSLSEIISIEQFKQLFLPQFNSRIKIISDDKFNILKTRYKFLQDQEAKLKKLLLETTTNEIIIKEYYNYDDNLSWNNYTEEKIKSSDKERELLKSFGFFYSKNTKTDTLIKKLTEAKVDAERINQIILALQVLQERNDKRLKTWRENDVANAFNFHDPGDDEYAIYLDFREQLSKILKIEEFKTVFVPQMQNRINRESTKEFEVIKNAYQFTDEQNKIIQDLVYEKNAEKIVTEEYYKYNWDLSQQKLRAVEFRHEKGIKETLRKFNEVRP